MSNAGSNPFAPIYDLNFTPPKTTEMEVRRQIMADLRQLATLINSNTLHYFNLPPIFGSIIVGNGSNFVILPPGLDGQVLTVNHNAPDGIDWEFISQNSNLFSDDLRRVLEEMLITLYSVLGNIEALKIIQVDVNGSTVGIQPELNFIAGNGIAISGRNSGNKIDVTISSGGNGGTVTTVGNVEAVAMSPGVVVAVDPGGMGVRFANASDDTRNAWGVVIDTIFPSRAGPVVVDGVLTLSDWTAAIGSVSLTPDQIYWMDTTNGKLSATGPSVAGQIVQIVGYALNSQTLKVSIEQRIML